MTLRETKILHTSTKYWNFSPFLQVYAILGVISLCQEYNEAPEEDGIHFEMGPVSKFNVHNGNFMEKNPLGDLN